MTLKEAYGVTAHILPWNSPMNQFARGAAPALAMGNSVVVKPAELTPITTLYLARLAIEAGMPAGCVNVVTGYGDAGDAMGRHPRSARITFKGSVATGRSEEPTSELQSLMRISYAVFCLKQKTKYSTL